MCVRYMQLPTMVVGSDIQGEDRERIRTHRDRVRERIMRALTHRDRDREGKIGHPECHFPATPSSRLRRVFDAAVFIPHLWPLPLSHWRL